MSEEDTPNITDPLAFWRSFYEANRDIWTQSLTHTISSDAFSTTMSAFLDHYLTTSASLQKTLDYYMGLWLASVNMPTREDLTRLERQLLQAEFPLDDLTARLDEATRSLQQDIAHLTSLLTAHREGSTEVEHRLRALEEQVRQVLETLHDQGTQVATVATAQNAGTREMRQHLQTMEERIRQMEQTLHDQASQIASLAGERSAESAIVDQRARDLEVRLDQFWQMLQGYTAQAASAGETQHTRMSALETRMHALETTIDQKSDQIYETLQSLQSHVQAALDQAAEPSSPSSRNPQARSRSRSEPPPSKQKPTPQE